MLTSERPKVGGAPALALSLPYALLRVWIQRVHTGGVGEGRRECRKVCPERKLGFGQGEVP